MLLELVVDADLSDEVDRLVLLGARVLDREPTRVVMADPDGNELRVLPA
ncbi:VOC family protein [Nocardioides sediminis]|nr:VOC family protein [Nocardioides sediminis]